MDLTRKKSERIRSCCCYCCVVALLQTVCVDRPARSSLTGINTRILEWLCDRDMLHLSSNNNKPTTTKPHLPDGTGSDNTFIIEGRGQRSFSLSTSIERGQVSSGGKMQPCPNKQKIPVVVVESHQHVCEHIHGVLRRKKVLRPWAMVHYDAHPDLACPNPAIPALACFRPRDPFRPADSVPTRHGEDNTASETNIHPKDLYEFLDSTNSGIAEWILPLVLAGNLTHVDWIRPARQKVEQLPAGKHVYQVGAWSGNQEGIASSFLDLSECAIVKVDWDCPYYQDDDSVVPEEQLLLPQPLHLSISEEYDKQPTTDMPFLLDVCLDYFFCHNPFVMDVQDLDQDVAMAFCRAVYNAIPFKYGSTRKECTRHRFIQDLLKCFSSDLDRSAEERSCCHVIDGFTARYYHDQTTKHILDLLDSIDKSKTDSDRLVGLIAEALPHMSMPHGSDDNQQEQCLDTFQRGLHCLDDDAPILITIARSSTDGFTPADKVEGLQTKVLQLIHKHFCGCNNSLENNSKECRLCIIYDYGAWEGSSLGN